MDHGQAHLVRQRHHPPSALGRHRRSQFGQEQLVAGSVEAPADQLLLQVLEELDRRQELLGAHCDQCREVGAEHHAELLLNGVVIQVVNCVLAWRLEGIVTATLLRSYTPLCFFVVVFLGACK